MSLANSLQYTSLLEAANRSNLHPARFREAARELGIEIVRERAGIVMHELLLFDDAERVAYFIRTGEREMPVMELVKRQPLEAAAAPAGEAKQEK